ncbi:MAG: hypothetical protein HYY36_05720 [Gammaproteobacteria bacterium]|nr:hypothetical protein [Gammaproteobacteria bacterium]
MAAFLGDIAFLLGIVVTVAGLFTLHRAAGDPRPVLLKTAGIVLLAAGIGTALCTGYYWLKYHFAGDLEHPYPALLSGGATMPGGAEHMMNMMKMHDRMRKERRQSGAAMGPDRDPGAGSEAEGHEEHHPE